jgi:hypothetical protein
MLIDGTNSGHKTGIEEGFDAGAKFHGGLLASMGDIGFQSAAARLNGGAAFGIERSEGGRGTLYGIGEDEINMNFDATPKLLEGAGGGLLQERVRFAGAGLEFQGDFLGHGLLLLHQTNELTVGDTSGGIFKFFRGLAHGLFDGGKILRTNFAGGAIDKASDFCQIIARFGGGFFDLLGEFVGAIAGLADELFIVAENFTQTPFGVAENLRA